MIKNALDKRMNAKVASFNVIQKDTEGKLFILHDNHEDKRYDVTVVADDGTGNADIQGLPVQLSAFLFNFTDKEICESALDVINVLITMYDSKGNGRINIVQDLPTQDQFES